MVNNSRHRGQAMIELVIVASLVLVPLFLAIPMLAKYLDIRSTAAQTARYAAWERTVWYGGDSASDMGWIVSRQWQANEKTDDQIRKEIGVRQLSETSATDAFSNLDRSANGFKGGVKALWQDRAGGKLLANYSDIQNTVDNGAAPGTLTTVFKPIADLASTLGPFVLEMNGKYTATVTLNVKNIDYNNHFLAQSSKTSFSEANVLLANGWSADGPDDDTKTSVKQQAKGLVPTSILDADVDGVKIMDYVLAALSIFLPEASKLEPGKIDPEVVPADRLK